MTTDAATERAARLAALRSARGQPPTGEANGDGGTAEPASVPVRTPPATQRGPAPVAADGPRRRSAAAASRVAITGACVTAFLLGIRGMAAPIPAATSPTPTPASTQPDGEKPAASVTAPPPVQPAPVIVVQVVPRPDAPDPGSTPAADPPPTDVTVPPPTSAPVVADELPAPPPPELPACEGSTCG